MLKRLGEYDRHHRGDKPAFYCDREIRWQLDIHTEHGAITSVTLSPVVDPDKPTRGVYHAIPDSGRSNGIVPHPGADKAKYVLPHVTGSAPGNRIAECHRAYVDLIRRWAALGYNDRMPTVLDALYQDFPTGVAGIDDVEAEDWVLTVVDGIPVPRCPSAAAFWFTEIEAKKGFGHSGFCLVCGETRSLARVFPVKVPARLLPGATQDAALVSINERIFGYNFTEGLTHTPICLVCTDSVVSGFVHLLSSDHAVSFPEQDTRMAWWVPNSEEVPSADILLTAAADEVTDLIRSVHSGTSSTPRQSARFCWMSVGGSGARVMVREWVDMPLAAAGNGVDNLDANIVRWFDDHRNTPRWTRPYTKPDGTVVEAGVQWHSLAAMVRCLGRWDPQKNRYAPLGVKNADRAPHAAHDLARSAILGVPLPPSLVIHLLHRIRNDGRVDDIRASLLRLALVRASISSPNPSSNSSPNPSSNRKKTVTIPLCADDDYTPPAYIAGRMFACLAHIQYIAHKPTGGVKSTYTDRYFRSAVESPLPALTRGFAESSAWLGKIRRHRNDNDEITVLEGELIELWEAVNQHDGLPLRCTLAQQAQFVMGYHHQLARTHNGRLSPAMSYEDDGSEPPVQ